MWPRTECDKCAVEIAVLALQHVRNDRWKASCRSAKKELEVEALSEQWAQTCCKLAATLTGKSNLNPIFNTSGKCCDYSIYVKMILVWRIHFKGTVWNSYWHLVVKFEVATFSNVHHPLPSNKLHLNIFAFQQFSTGKTYSNDLFLFSAFACS